MISAEGFSPNSSDQILGEEASLETRLAAAGGEMLIVPADAAPVFSKLVDDPDPAVREKAAATVANLPPDRVLDLIRDRRAGAALVHQIAKSHLSDQKILNFVLHHPSLGSETIKLLIYQGSPETHRTLSTLRAKLKVYPELIELLLQRPELDSETKEALTFLLETIAPPKTVEAPAAVEEEKEEAAGPPEVPPELEVLTEEERQPTSEEVKTWQERLIGMSVSEKIYWALKGNKEVRMHLIRDANKMVSMTVLQSPKLTEGEIYQITNMTNVSQEVLRQIAANNQWMSRYQVMSNMAKNPKTPVGIAIRSLSRLQKRDLQEIIHNKGISQAVRDQATKILKRRP